MDNLDKENVYASIGNVHRNARKQTHIHTHTTSNTTIIAVVIMPSLVSATTDQMQVKVNGAHVQM